MKSTPGEHWFGTPFANLRHGSKGARTLPFCLHIVKRL